MAPTDTILVLRDLSYVTTPGMQPFDTESNEKCCVFQVYTTTANKECDTDSSESVSVSGTVQTSSMVAATHPVRLALHTTQQTPQMVLSVRMLRNYGAERGECCGTTHVFLTPQAILDAATDSPCDVVGDCLQHNYVDSVFSSMSQQTKSGTVSFGMQVERVGQLPTAEECDCFLEDHLAPNGKDHTAFRELQSELAEAFERDVARDRDGTAFYAHRSCNTSPNYGACEQAATLPDRCLAVLQKQAFWTAWSRGLCIAQGFAGECVAGFPTGW